MKFGSLFSGVGGFDLGLERAGMECAWTVEYDKQARSVLRKQWPNVSHYEDVHDVGSSQLTSVDLICGGFPCQDYSVAGKRSGLVGDRGALWWEMHRIIAECRPTWVVGENVPGLLSSNGGADFRTIIASLVQLGYGATWATLDSQYFGVAQRRRRLFIVGHSGGVPRPEILAISEGLFGHPAPSREAGERVAPSVTAGAPFARTGNERVEADAIVAQCLTARDAKGPLPSPELGNVVVFTPESVHVDGTREDGTHHPLRVAGHAAVFNATGFSKYAEKDTATTLRAVGHKGTDVDLVGSSIPRRLTPLECERLQGFPDGHTEFYADGTRVADGPRYRMLRNAVTVNVAEWIGRRIVEAKP